MNMRYLVLTLSASLAVALAVPALGGSAGPAATVAANAKKQAKKALKQAKKAQQAADAAQGSADAAQGSADAAQASADAITGRSAYDASCDPASAGTFLDCVGVTLTLGQAGRVLVNASGGQESVGGVADGICHLEVDDSTIPATANTPGEAATDNTNGLATNGFANTGVTDVLSAGSHTFELSCTQGAGDQLIADAMISAVRISG